MLINVHFGVSIEIANNWSVEFSWMKIQRDRQDVEFECERSETEGMPTQGRKSPQEADGNDRVEPNGTSQDVE